MKSFRAIVALLIGVAIAITPVGAAWASIKGTAANSQRAVVAMVSADAVATADMTDCEKMMRTASGQGQSGTGKGDCACCDAQNACPPDLCVFQCVKAFGTVVPVGDVRALAALRFQREKPDRPPDWIAAPQPPPPRA